MTTPEDLLTMCCQFPACYDPLYELCIDTCRKCETVYPVTSWLPCPPLLNIPDCTSPNLSYMVRRQGLLPGDSFIYIPNNHHFELLMT